MPALLIISIFVLPAAGGFTESEFQCEEAAVVLDECCPAISASALACSRLTGCAGETVRPPMFTVAESECIEDLDCDEIIEAGICERVVERQTNLETDFAFAERVCP